MPTSWSDFDQEIRGLIERGFPERDTPIIDVGAGAGKYRDLLHDYTDMTAVEVWEPYIGEYRLRERYRAVFCLDARSLTHTDEWCGYKLAIFGDVIEHMGWEYARIMLDAAQAAGCAQLVVVPFRYIQGEAQGNPHERHVQDDLTNELFLERYPGFACVVRNERLGLYVRDMVADRTRELEQPKVGELKLHFDASNVRLAIATPSYGGTVTTQYLVSLFETQADLNARRIHHRLLMIATASVEKARNMLVANFMATDCTHLLFIDVDQGWKPVNVLRLLTMDRDVIGIAARKKTTQPVWAVNFISDEALVENGAMEVAEVGTGFLMIQRTVIEQMFRAYPQFKIEVKGDAEEAEEIRPHYYALFQNELTQDGAYRSEDLTFCNRWREIGGRVWVDPHGDIVHVGTCEFRGALASLIQGELP